MNRFSTLLLTSVLAGSLGACSDDPAVTPTDGGVTPTDTGASCSPPPDAGGPRPYFQCTSDNVCPTGRYMNNAMDLVRPYTFPGGEEEPLAASVISVEALVSVIVCS